ncbi:MAG TPA: response regulator transcription factor [Dehalococcoidia bacterium]|jgi:DNA-binding NarL/FixJ family response regulator|nr:response regulator transcription factor [Dehalococcoidia bacterium]
MSIEDNGVKEVSEITIGVIDRSELFKAGVRQKLSEQRGFRLLDCDPDGEPLRFIDANSVDVVLLDIDFPVSEGLELGREITQHYPNTRVIILSSYFHEEELFKALKTGAVAYIDKRTSTEDLVGVIRRASRGEYPINDCVFANPAIADRVIRQFQEIASMGLVQEKVAAPLTHREIQILSCIANGGTNKQVAHMLGISEQTIKNHVSAILRKLNANDRAHAVALAIRNQWVTVYEK